MGLQYTGAINAAVVYSTIPVIIVFVTVLFYRERITLRQGLGGVTSFLGVMLIISKGAPTDLFDLHANVDDLWILAAAITWAGYSVFLRHYPPSLHLLAFLLSIMVTGLIALAPFYA